MYRMLCSDRTGKTTSSSYEWIYLSPQVKPVCSFGFLCMHQFLFLFLNNPTITITYLYAHNFHTCLYDSTNKYFFTSLSATPEIIAQKEDPSCHNLHIYTQTSFTRHCTLQHMI